MNVLVPFDVSPVSERAVETALDCFGNQVGVHISAVHFSRGEDDPAEIAAQRVQDMAKEYDVTIETEIQVIEHGDDSKSAVREAITDYIEDNDIELVILGHEEKSLLDDLFRRDTTERVLEMHDTPVLLVP
jgi:nucleotide-binding universal stress UspA family protein